MLSMKKDTTFLFANAGSSATWIGHTYISQLYVDLIHAYYWHIVYVLTLMSSMTRAGYIAFLVFDKRFSALKRKNKTRSFKLHENLHVLTEKIAVVFLLFFVFAKMNSYKLSLELLYGYPLCFTWEKIVFCNGKSVYLIHYMYFFFARKRLLTEILTSRISTYFQAVFGHH